MNQTAHIGYMAKDPVIEYNKKNNPFVRFQLVCRSVYSTDSIPYILGGKRALKFVENVKKGDMVGMTGVQKANPYQDKEGNTKYYMENAGNSITYLGKRNQEGLYEEIPLPDWADEE